VLCGEVDVGGNDLRASQLTIAHMYVNVNYYRMVLIRTRWRRSETNAWVGQTPQLLRKAQGRNQTRGRTARDIKSEPAPLEGKERATRPPLLLSRDQFFARDVETPYQCGGEADHWHDQSEGVAQEVESVIEQPAPQAEVQHNQRDAALGGYRPLSP
jgi:hypothetical protein